MKERPIFDMAEVRETPGQKITKPFRKVGRSIRNYLARASESPSVIVDRQSVFSDKKAEKKVNGSHEHGERPGERQAVAEVKNQLQLQSEIASLKPIAEMRQLSEDIFSQANQEAENSTAKRAKSKSLRIASWVETAQDAVSNARLVIPTASIDVPIGKIVPPVILGGLFGLPFVAPESSFWVTPTLGILGGLTAGETVTKIRESKFFEQRREQKILKKLEKSENVTADSLSHYFKEFSEIVEPGDVRDVFRLDTEEGKFADLVRIVGRKTMRENPLLKGRRAKENWDMQERERTVHLVMEAQLKAQVRRGEKRTMHAEAFDRTRDLATGVVIIGGPAFLIPAAGLVDDVLNGINAGVTLASTIARRFIKPVEKKPQVIKMPHGVVRTHEKEVGRVEAVKLYSPLDARRQGKIAPTNSPRVFNPKSRR